MDTTPPSGAGNRERALALADTYLDTVPRFASRPEAVGPFTVFVSSAPWPYYARPTPAGHGELSADDVAAVGAMGVLGRVLEADDPSLAPTMAAVEAGFRTPGTAVGREDVDERDRL